MWQLGQVNRPVGREPAGGAARAQVPHTGKVVSSSEVASRGGWSVSKCTQSE